VRCNRAAMRASASAPTFRQRSTSVLSCGSIAEQPIPWSQGEVHCEQQHDSPPVSRWAGKLRQHLQKRRHPAEQSPSTEDAQPEDWPSTPPGVALLPPVHSKVVPSSLLAGVSSSTRSANQTVQDQGVRLARITNTRRRSHSLTAVDKVDEKAFERLSSRLTANVTDIRTRHETFQPMNAAQKARAALFVGKSSARRSGGASRGHDEEEITEEDIFKEKVEAWKYVRKIEPELPPLVPLPSEYARVKVDQTVINFNARSDVLGRNAPDAQLEFLAYRGASREAHHCVVAELRARRRADFLAKRRADAFQPRTVEEVEEEEPDFVNEEGADGIAEKWFVGLSMLSFAFIAHEEIKLRNMSSKEREDYVEENASRLQIAKTTSGYVKQALVISTALKEPVTKGRMKMLECMFVCMIKTRKQRKISRTIVECLGKWHQYGNLFLFLKRFGVRIKFVQQWWRKVCVPKLVKARAKLYQRWLRLERFDIIKDIKTRDQKESAFKSGRSTPPRGGRASLLHGEHHEVIIPMEDRIALQLIAEPVRWTFIENELRTRRYQLLPQIAMWEEDVRSWDKELLEWEETRKALQVMGIIGADHGALRWPPQRPTYMPAEFGEEREKGNAEVLDMIRRARAHPNGGGWSEVPKKVLGQTITEMGALQASKKQGNGLLGGDEDNPFGHVSHQELQAFQVSDEALPIEFRETAPGMKAPEWRQRP